MTNTERIQANNAELRECIETAEALPDAGGGADAVIESLSVTANGTYTAPDGVDGYSPVTVNVPIPDGYIVPSGTLAVTENGTHKVTEFDEVNVNVPIPDGYIIPSGTKAITENGTHDVTEYASVDVNVEASGGDNGELKALIERTVTEITLPSDLTQIGGYAFNSCAMLTLTSLPDGITSIGGNAFQGCTALALTSLPDGITSIGGNAFMNCYKLALTHLPSSLTSLGVTAFRTCTGLRSITFQSTPTMGANVFFGCSQLKTINVPWAEGEVANAPWGATSATINYNYTGE